MALRVVQWATGGVGVAAIKGVLEHPDLELVGCWVHSEAKNGKDVGEIIGVEPVGVTATNSIEDILALEADAVIYAPLMANPDEVAALLRSGKNVVTPVGWVYPSEKQGAPMREAASPATGRSSKRSFCGGVFGTRECYRPVPVWTVCTAGPAARSARTSCTAPNAWLAHPQTKKAATRNQTSCGTGRSASTSP